MPQLSLDWSSLLAMVWIPLPSLALAWFSHLTVVWTFSQVFSHLVLHHSLNLMKRALNSPQLALFPYLEFITLEIGVCSYSHFQYYLLRSPIVDLNQFVSV